MRDLIKIKGGKEGLRLVVDKEAEWQTVLSCLQTQFDQSGSFFAGAQVIVEIGDRYLDDQQLTDMLSLMHHYGVEPESLATTVRESRAAARSVGLQTRAMPSAQRAPSPLAQPEGDSTLVCRTVRSGQVVRHHGHITLIGDVNPGAEVIAGGSVVVWGRLRGLVHAGALGDGEALVCALDFRPTQLRIANLIARTPDGMGITRPEIARIEHGHIVVTVWEHYKKEAGSGK